MLGELILVRHGTAESKDTAKNDFDRKLTKEGIQEFRGFVPTLIPLLEGKYPLYVWTSPLVRAQETADLLTVEMGRDAAEDKDFLGDGNSEGLLQALKELEDGFTVVAVGHEPFLSMWAKELTGSSLPFPKGGAAAIKFEDADSSQGKVDWKLAPKQGDKWGKADSSSQKKKKKGKTGQEETKTKEKTEPLDEVKQVLLKQMEAVSHTHRNFVNNPYEPETTHQLRVSMRRLRGLLNFLKPAMAEEEYQTLNESLREAGNRLGSLRELDVLIAECTELAHADPELIDNYAAVFHFLHKARSKELRSLLVYSRMKGMEQLITEAKDNLEQLQLRLADRDEEDWNSFLSRRLDRKAERLRQDFQGVDHADYSASHQVRIQAKKVRYAAANFGKFMKKGKAKRISERAEKLQNELGRYCDLYVNAQTLADYAKKTEDPPLQEAFRKLSQHQTEKRQELLAAENGK